MTWRCLITGVSVGSLLFVLGGCKNGSSGPDGEPVSFRDQVAAAQKETIPDVRAKKLIKIGYQQGKAQDQSGANETLAIATKACQEIEDAASRAGAYALLAEAQAKLENRSDGQNALELAQEASDQIDHLETKARTLTRLARAQAALEDHQGADTTLKLAEQLAGQLKAGEKVDVYGQVLVLAEVAKTYHKIGNLAGADRVLGSALELSGSLEDGRTRCEAITEIAATQTELGKAEAAAETLDTALEIAGQIEAPYGKANALADVAEKLSEAGLHAKTHKVLEEADLVAHKIPEPDIQGQTVERVRILMGTLPKPAG